MNFLPQDLHDGDYVVDQQHGIGIYRGLTPRTIPAPDGGEPVEREFLALEYAGGDRVYVPAERADRVHPYVGGDGTAPTLNHLTGQGWAHATAKAREHVRKIAAELAALYAARQAARGHAYAPDTPPQKAMEAAFPYPATPDQLKAIRDVKQDLESPRPMDRLIVGDVGFGKTEVAVRAAFKVTQEGRQVIVLCPTSVLASQHYATFSARLGPFGARVEMLSRFRSAHEQQEVLEGLRSGAIDVVVGTHRMLSDDVKFHDLGLVIVDEEQRFGVVHKEKLKKLRDGVDALTLTATPIPRTLHMALAGLRDVTLMSDPPEGRVPVETVIGEYQDAVVQEAIRRELVRGGQAYFLHNRVETIHTVLAQLEQLVPEARFGAAHGQMDEAALEETMADFHEQKLDVLVCTTIIEAGVDISNANTLIVGDADQLGLAQLYQIRGRVGRSNRQAYAIFLYRDAAALTEIARQRLAALKEFSELGAGQKIALRDMELRGAGSLLGLEQSGATAAVGLDLYLRMLENAVRRLQGQKANARLVPLPPVDLPVSTGVPADYVPSERERLRIYNRIVSVRTQAEIDRLRAQLEEHHGSLPKPVENALALAQLRLGCRAAGVKEISSEPGHITLLLRTGTALPAAAAQALHEVFEKQLAGLSEDRIVLTGVPAFSALPAARTAVEILADVRAAHAGAVESKNPAK